MTAYGMVVFFRDSDIAFSSFCKNFLIISAILCYCHTVFAGWHDSGFFSKGSKGVASWPTCTTEKQAGDIGRTKPCHTHHPGMEFAASRLLKS